MSVCAQWHQPALVDLPVGFPARFAMGVCDFYGCMSDFCRFQNGVHNVPVTKKR